MNSKTGTLTFATTTQRWGEETEKRIHRYQRYIALSLFTAVIEASPVGNPSLWESKRHAEWALKRGYVGGRFRANWHVGIDREEIKIVDSPNFTANEGNLVGQVADAKLGQEITLTNSMPYGYRLEYGWSKKQAPLGFLRLQFARITELERASLAKAKQGGPLT